LNKFESVVNKAFDFQENRFSSIIPYFFSTPFYKRKLEEAGITQKHIRCLADLSKVPFTYKNEVRNSSPFERTPLKKEDIYAIFSSGGTSGNPTLYVWSEEDVVILKEVAKNIFFHFNVNPTDMALILAPLSLPVMGHCMIHQYEASGISFVPLGPADPETVTSFLQQLPITLIATLPVVASRLYEFIRYSQKAEINENIKIKQFHFGGDYLSNARRTRLQTNWNTNCYDLYGISEIFGPVAGECEFKNGLHFPDEYVYIEVLDPITKLPVPDGEQGVAVYTTLWRKGFPLLRYWSDDYITRDSHQCQCGQTSSRITYYGRPLDCVKIKDKTVFAKNVEEVVLKYPLNDEYFIKYENGYVYAEVEPMPEFLVLESEMKDELSELLHLPVEVTRKIPGTLPRTEIKPKRLIGFPQDL
jgi:phenylacetate-CoA ligase